MNGYQNALIKEHQELSSRVDILNNYIASGESFKYDDKIEFANKVSQLKAMKAYRDALTARLVNSGIVEEDGVYFEKVMPYSAIPEKGNDYDLDSSSSPVEEIDGSTSSSKSSSDE